MTQETFLRLVAIRAGIPPATAERANRALMYYLRAHIRRAYAYTWRGWGTYYRAPQYRTEYKNPRTGLHAHTQGTLVIRFRPSDHVLNRIQP